MAGIVMYVTNPSKVPKKMQKFLYPVVVGGEEYWAARVLKNIGKPPKAVVYHPHMPTFQRILKELRNHGVNLRVPLYGFMLAGKFHAHPGKTGW